MDIDSIEDVKLRFGRDRHAWGREKKTLSARIKTLETETVPDLCRQLDELKAQRQFLFKAFRSACEQYGSTQGMKDYAGDVADGALKILGVNIDQFPENPKASQYRDALRACVDALKASGDGRFDRLVMSEAIAKLEALEQAAIAKAEALLR